VRLLFFGILKDLAKKPDDTLELPEGARVAELLLHYEQQNSRLKEAFSSLAVAVNGRYASAETELKNDDEVALLPPVSGGVVSSCVQIVRDTIDTSAWLEKIKRGDDGAAVVFEGVVRNQTRGRKTLYLLYESYETMALSQMEELAAQALKQFQIRDVALVHRLGRLEIGETSVLIVVASAHRAAAFDACRWLIDTLKKTVPIWKKEFFADGAVWADGEGFPEEIRANSRATGSPEAEDASK
jgi:molybdopterin synthase catalytic subunit